MLTRVAVMLTCFNRKMLTLRCLSGLSDQFQRDTDRIYDVYVYDDGSTDGTYEALVKFFPGYHIIKGKGNLYWCKSMNLLMQLAVKELYDFYLMVNDDVFFFDDAIENMFQSYKIAECICGIVGTTKDLLQKATYGGHDQKERLIIPNRNLQKCRWANWNCFLVDKYVIEKIGIIDGKYEHAWGDYDYSDRMLKGNIPIYVASKYVGICEIASFKGTYRDTELGRLIRLRRLLSPKGLPIYSYVRYNIRSEGIGNFFKALRGYCSLIWYILLKKEIN